MSPAGRTVALPSRLGHVTWRAAIGAKPVNPVPFQKRPGRCRQFSIARRQPHHRAAKLNKTVRPINRWVPLLRRIVKRTDGICCLFGFPSRDVAGQDGDAIAQTDEHRLFRGIRKDRMVWGQERCTIRDCIKKDFATPENQSLRGLFRCAPIGPQRCGTIQSARPERDLLSYLHWALPFNSRLTIASDASSLQRCFPGVIS